MTSGRRQVAIHIDFRPTVDIVVERVVLYVQPDAAALIRLVAGCSQCQRTHAIRSKLVCAGLVVTSSTTG